MDKFIIRNEANDKKIDFRVKDRGDLKKANDKTLKKSEGNMQMNMNLAFPECGDTVEKFSVGQKPEKPKINVGLKKTNEDSKMKYLISGTAEKEFLNKNNYDKDKMAKSHSELRKRIRDRYTIKLNSPGNKSDHVTLSRSKKESGGNSQAIKTDGENPGQSLKPLPGRQVSQTVPAASPEKQLSEGTTQTPEKSKPSSAASTKTPTKPDKLVAKLGKEENRNAKRKPIIKTITSKTGPVRVFKAVTFVDHSRSPRSTPLEIKIPVQMTKKQSKVSKYTETSPLKYNPKVTVSKASSSKPSISSKQASFKQEKLSKLAAVRKRAERRRDRKFRHGRASAASIKEPPSPPTEVARWTPASADPQTIPYYEAWIDTTLAAIAKTTKQDKINYEKQAKLLINFQKALEERPTSPELFYANCADEKYTGRIKIRQKERSRRKQLFPTA